MNVNFILHPKSLCHTSTILSADQRPMSLHQIKLLRFHIILGTQEFSATSCNLESANGTLQLSSSSNIVPQQVFSENKTKIQESQIPHQSPTGTHVVFAEQPTLLGVRNLHPCWIDCTISHERLKCELVHFLVIICNNAYEAENHSGLSLTITNP